MTSLAEQILAGKRRAIARQISRIEDQHPQALTVLTELFPHTGKGYLVGITGPPGTGKSTLANQIAREYRRAYQKTVAVLAIDPTSPFTGGAILGDRIRLNDLAGDPGVFVRSMATRGYLGGLARAAADAIKVFDAAGFDVILIETVGVGQAEVEIASLAHTVLVVDVPGLGDDVQAIKAGILEIADIFVVNKADRKGADKTAATLQTMLNLNNRRQPVAAVHHGQLLDDSLPINNDRPETGWRPPLCKTVATSGAGIRELVAAIQQHRQHQINTQTLQQRERRRLIFEIEQIIKTRLLSDLINALPPAELDRLVSQVMARRLDPYTAADQLFELVGLPTTKEKT